MTTSTYILPHRRRGYGGLLAATLVCFIGAALPARPARGQKSPLSQAATQRAQVHLAARRYTEAIADLQTAIRYEPRFALGWYLLASSHRRAGDCDRAVAAYRRYSELRPVDADPHYGIGLCLQAVGDGAGAVAEFQQYAELEKRPSAGAFVGDARRRVEGLSHALAVAAASSKSSIEPPALVQARKLGETRHVPEAIAIYRKWLDENPRAQTEEAARASFELGALLIVSREEAAAAPALRAATRLNPADARAWYDLAFALRQSGRLTEAVDAYFRYVTLKSKDPDPYYGLGLSLSALGRDDEALTAWRTYVHLEKRPGEQRWVKKARADMARLAGGSGGQAVAQGPAGGPGEKPATAVPPHPTAVGGGAPAGAAAAAPPGPLDRRPR